MPATPEATEALLELGRELLAAVRDLRADLKRRSERDLKDAGRIPANAPSGGNGDGGACFPNYGRSKNMPIEGAAMAELEYYQAGCLRTLDDPAKSRFHRKERVLLDAIHAEIRRQSGGDMEHGVVPPREPEPPDFGPPPDDSDIPF